MGRRQNQKKEVQHKYEILVNDWNAEVLFNDLVYQSVLDDREFEERISIDMLGRINSTTSKKCKESMTAIRTVSPSNSW